MLKKSSKAKPKLKKQVYGGPWPGIQRKWIDVECQPDGMLASPEDGLFGETFPPALLIPKSQWKAKVQELEELDWFALSEHPRGCIVANHAPLPYTQSPESSCVYNATCGAWMRRFAISNGLQNAVRLSPMSGYCRVATHRHSGAYVWRAMELMRDEGVLPSSTYKNQAKIFPHTFHENTPFQWPKSLPSGWQESARNFRVVEWCSIRSIEEYGSALLHQMPVVMGRNGHSMVAEDLVLKGGNFYARICDSYGPDSRDGTGRVYDSERMMERSCGGAWACRVVTRPNNLFEWQLA